MTELIIADPQGHGYARMVYRLLRYRANVLKSRQRILDAELESILERYDCSQDELLALRHWVAEGNSPYENPDGLFNENGLTCDFIAASRMLEAVFDDIDDTGGDLG